jgi:hypothetical protein
MKNITTHNNTTYQIFPNVWRFVPIRRNSKAPIGKEWQKSGRTWDEMPRLGDQYKGQEVGAIGCLCGEPSEGALFVDCDGESAKSLLWQWATQAGETVPETWIVTSGREGRGQLVFQVAQEYWADIETRKYKSDSGEFLELRWTGCQSIVYGKHPSGSEYRWMATDGAIADAPLWLIEKMLKEVAPEPKAASNGSKGFSGDKGQHQPKGANVRWADFDRNFKLPTLDAVPLEICLTRSDRDLIESGAGNGSRNDAGFALAVNLIATAAYLEVFGQRYQGTPEELFDRFCHACPSGDGWSQKEWAGIWKSAQKTQGGTSLTPEAIEGCIKTWAWKNGDRTLGQTKESRTMASTSTKNETVASTVEVDAVHSTPTGAGATSTVETVAQILEEGLKDWQEMEALTKLQAESGMSKDVFWAMVATNRLENSFREQIQANVCDRPDFDWRNLPKGLEKFFAQLKSDSRKRSIDPMATFWAALPAVMSVLPKNAVLNMDGSRFPAILWSALLMESGHGKSRAEGLIYDPIRAMQCKELKEFKDRVKQYEKDKADAAKNGDDEPAELEEQRKLIFNITTIAALLESLRKQKEYGSVWVRDEVAGIFKSLGQFSKGDNEDREIFLALWDGATAFVDRKGNAFSEVVEDPRLSLFGGLQPGKFRQIFKDENDADGLAARILFAYPKVVIEKHSPGEVKLPFLMRNIFERLQCLNMDMRPSSEAYELWRNVEHTERLRAEHQRYPAFAAWMRKATGHVARLSIAVHALECGIDPRKNTQVITEESMTFAIDLYRYSKQSYEFMLNQGNDSEDVGAILSKVLSKANQLGGLTAREACQFIKGIGTAAKACRKTPSAYALDMFSILVEQGKGTFEKVGRTKKFIPVLHQSQNQATVSTVDEIIEDIELEDGLPTSTVEATPEVFDDYPEEPRQAEEPMHPPTREAEPQPSKLPIDAPKTTAKDDRPTPNGKHPIEPDSAQPETATRKPFRWSPF